MRSDAAAPDECELERVGADRHLLEAIVAGLPARLGRSIRRAGRGIIGAWIPIQLPLPSLP
jgi:hypothetical protein